MSLFESASLVVTPNGTKAGKLYAIKPTDGSGDLVVTRETTATRVNSAGLIENVAVNVPRLDYSNGTCPSILVEPQRTNITLQSENLATTWYTAGGLLTSNATTAPDGNTTADKIKADTTNDIHVYQQTLTVVSGVVYTMSVFVKAGEYTFFELSDSSTLKAQTFNLTAKTISAPQTGGFSAATSSNIEDIGNGWLRCSITYTTESTTAFFRMSLSNGTNTSFAGNNTNGLFVWGAQLEEGSYATSYIPTIASTVTRNADVISKTGISSLIGQTEGVMYFDLKSIADNNFKRLSINGGSYVNSIFFDFNNSNNLYLKVFNSGSAVAALLASGVNIANRNKIAIAYKNNDFSFYVNGTQVASQSSGSVPSGLANYEFSLGGNEKFIGNINASALWKTRLSNTELATLTTI
jgi:hypothetical protein